MSALRNVGENVFAANLKPREATVASAAKIKRKTLWEAGGGAKRLLRLKVANRDAEARYVQLFTFVDPGDGKVPFQQWSVGANETLVLVFGQEGMVVLQQDTDRTVLDAGAIAISTTAGELTLLDEGEGVDIEAWFV